jgi:hypothetical protein
MNQPPADVVHDAIMPMDSSPRHKRGLKKETGWGLRGKWRGSVPDCLF